MNCRDGCFLRTSNVTAGNLKSLPAVRHQDYNILMRRKAACTAGGYDAVMC